MFLQTKIPDAPVIPHIVDNNYTQFYNSQLSERMMFHYPPFYRLVYIYMKHREIAVLEEFSELMGQQLRKIFENRILGPDLPPVARVKELYIRKIVLKVENGLSQYKVNEALQALQQALTTGQRYRSITMYYDVDPL